MSQATELFRKFAEDWKTNDTKENSFLVAGAISLILAVIGIFLPIVPQVPFAILSAYLFSKGSPTLHKWVRKNKYFGKPVRDWEDQKAVAPKMKIISSVMMAAGAAIGHWKFEELTYAFILDGIFAAAILFVVTRKSPDPKKTKAK
jgi:uncharacterized membrane protein YbaN (DUF454 family)